MGGDDALKRDVWWLPLCRALHYHLHMKAVSPDLVKLKTPFWVHAVAGLRVMAGNPQDGRILLVMDYAYINVKPD